MKHVYILEAGNGHKKIGIAKDVKKRIGTLKTGISTGIKSVWITDQVNDAHKIERMLHKSNESIRLNGEWFDGELDLCGVEFVNKIGYGIKKPKSKDGRNDFVIHLDDPDMKIIKFTLKHGGARSLFDYLSMYMDDNNAVSIRNDVLAKNLNLSLSAVNKQIKTLKDNNLISSERVDGMNVFYLNNKIITTQDIII